MGVTYLPATENITGASCTGSNGGMNRTYTLSNTPYNNQAEIHVQGVFLHSGTDYTLSGSVVTFINALFNSNLISISYSYASSTATVLSASGSQATYATPLQLAQFMAIEAKIPKIGGTSTDRSKENVGAGSATVTDYFLDNGAVLTESVVLSYGPSEAQAGTALVTPTHYTLAEDTGRITLTAAGTAQIGSNTIFAKYSYINNGLTETQLQNALNRAQAEIDKNTHNHWVDSGTATPDYIQATEEKQRGKGRFDRDYYLENFPIPNVSTTLSSGITPTSGTAIAVGSTDDFPSSGYISIESEKIRYTGKTATRFDAGTAFTASHGTASVVYPYVIEISVTDAGTSPTFTTLQRDSDYDIDLNTGRVHLYRDDLILGNTLYQSPPLGIPNRMRATYIYGTDGIPTDITKVTLMVAAKDLLHSAVRSAHSRGLNSFEPDLIDVDQKDIDAILDRHRNFIARNI